MLGQLDDARATGAAAEPVLALASPTETTAPMFGAQRSDNTIALLVPCCARAPSTKPQRSSLKTHTARLRELDAAARLAEKIPAALVVLTRVRCRSGASRLNQLQTCRPPNR